ncbi:MAG: hypothetical protein Q8880_13435, partial [Bacteroidota bacterium]|nr:hypothetical protein [Bacteroidota bacterium]
FLTYSGIAKIDKPCPFTECNNYINNPGFDYQELTTSCSSTPLERCWRGSTIWTVGKPHPRCVSGNDPNGCRWDEQFWIRDNNWNINDPKNLELNNNTPGFNPVVNPGTSSTLQNMQGNQYIGIQIANANGTGSGIYTRLTETLKKGREYELSLWVYISGCTHSYINTYNDGIRAIVPGAKAFIEIGLSDTIKYEVHPFHAIITNQGPFNSTNDPVDYKDTINGRRYYTKQWLYATGPESVSNIKEAYGNPSYSDFTINNPSLIFGNYQWIPVKIRFIANDNHDYLFINGRSNWGKAGDTLKNSVYNFPYNPDSVASYIYIDSVNLRLINPSVLRITPDSTGICKGDLTTLTVTDSLKYGILFKYIWNPQGSGIDSMYTVSPTKTTTYSVTVMRGSATCDTLISKVIVSRPVVKISPRDTAICNGDSVRLRTNVTDSIKGNITYLWSSGQSSDTITVKPTVTTIYYVTATNSIGCTAVDSVVVYVNPLPVADAGEDKTICLYDTVSLIATGEGTYLWSYLSQTTNMIIVHPNNTTTYTVTVTNSNGCSSSDGVVVNVNIPPLANASANLTNACPWESVNLTAAGAGIGGSYSWNTGCKDNACIVSGITIPTTFTVTVTDSNKCTSSADVTVGIRPNCIVANAGKDTSVCRGSTIKIGATGGGTYSWSTGETTDSISVSPYFSTTYIVTVTNGGFTAKDTVVVTVKSIPSASINQIYKICRGDTGLIIASGGKSYLWNTGEINDT